MSFLPGNNTRRLELNRQAFYLGLISISLQVVYARLAVSFAGGNEIYLSIFFLFWLVFTGLGAFLIKKPNPKILFKLLGVFSLILPSLFYVSAKIFGFLSGQLVPPLAFLLIIVMILLPVCLLNGGLFSSIAFHLKGESKSSRTYWSEALGAIVGGVATTVFYLVGGRDYSLLLGLAILCICLVPVRRLIFKIAILIVFHITIIFGPGDFIEERLLKYHYKPYEYSGSVSGRLVRYDAVETGEILSLYSGGVKAADFPDNESPAELFYWPYLVDPDIKRIAFVGAGMYSFASVIPGNVEAYFIFPDKSWRKLTDLKYQISSKNIILADPIDYFRAGPEKYDAIIINRGYLLSLYDKRLETEYFFKLCRSSLTQEGFLCINISSYQGIWRDDLKVRMNYVYDILKSLFQQVQVIPGERIIFMAGDNIRFDMSSIIENMRFLKIDSPYFNEALVKSRLNQFNLNQTLNQLGGNAKNPGIFEIGHGLSYYFSKMTGNLKLSKIIRIHTVLMIFLFMAVLSFISSGFSKHHSVDLVNIVFFGMASFAIELLAMYKLQLLGGYLYLALGIMIGLFMLGMALGSFVGTYLIKEPNLPKKDNKGLIWAYGIFILLAGLYFLKFNSEIILLVIIGLAGFGGGFGFALSAKRFDHKPGLPYSFDLFGGVLGTIIGLGILSGGLNHNTILLGIMVFGMILLATNRVLSKY